MTGGDEFSEVARRVADPNKLAPVIGSAVQIHREQLDDQRRAALDVSAVLQTRLNRYLSVAGILALGDDGPLAEAVQAGLKAGAHA